MIPDLHRDLIDEIFGAADDSIPTNITRLADNRYLVVTVDHTPDDVHVQTCDVTIVNDRRITYVSLSHHALDV